MKCPFCGYENTQVKDSRAAEEGAAIRRRRQCDHCGARFTSYERVQLREITVLKSDGSQEPFKHEKLLRSMTLALRKRPVEEEWIHKAVNSIVRQLETGSESQVTTEEIGHKVMLALYGMDKVAYVRYASVYHDFDKPDDFNDFIKDLHQKVKLEEEAN